MANKYVHKATFESLQQHLRTTHVHGDEPIHEDSEAPLGQYFRARGLLNLALAALVFREDVEPVCASVCEPVVLRYSRDIKIYIDPGPDGAIFFGVSTQEFRSVGIRVRPTDFDLTDPVQLDEFRVYRTLVDIVRRLPVTTREEEDESGERIVTIFGVFSVLCGEDDPPRWIPVWKWWDEWEHPHQA